MEFLESYSMPVEDAEDKLALIHEEFCRCNLGDATCNKVEQMLEQMQPYPGDPANVL